MQRVRNRSGVYLDPHYFEDPSFNLDFSEHDSDDFSASLFCSNIHFSVSDTNYFSNSDLNSPIIRDTDVPNIKYQSACGTGPRVGPASP